MYVERVLITDLQRVSGGLERKAAAVGCVKLLCESQHFTQGELAQRWPELMQVILYDVAGVSCEAPHYAPHLEITMGSLMLL